MKITTVLFDMDGTLLSTLDDLMTSVNFALEQSGLPPVSFDEARLAAGYGSVVLIEEVTKHAFPTGSPEFQKVYDDFSARYAAHRNDTTEPYDGIMELLSALKERGIKTAVVSNKWHTDTEALRKKWFDGLIPLSVGRSDTMPAKPAPDMALAALHELGSTPEQAIYLGDSEPDAQVGKASGCVSVCCTWGFRDVAVLERQHPDFIIDTPAQLLDVIDGLDA